jgi:hypothetical protein
VALEGLLLTLLLLISVLLLVHLLLVTSLRLLIVAGPCYCLWVMLLVKSAVAEVLSIAYCDYWGHFECFLLLASLLLLPSLLLLLFHDASGTSAAVAAAGVLSISITPAVASVPAVVAYPCTV